MLVEVEVVTDEDEVQVGDGSARITELPMMSNVVRMFLNCILIDVGKFEVWVARRGEYCVMEGRPSQNRGEHIELIYTTFGIQFLQLYVIRNSWV